MLLRFAMLAVLVAAPGLVMAETPPDAGIETTVQRYADGLRLGDAGLLREAFSKDGRFLRAGQDGQLGDEPFDAVLDDWARRPDAAVVFKVASVSMPAPGMAAVTGRLRMSTDCYHDQLLLLKLAVGWRIVAKTTIQQSCAGFDP